MNKELEEILKHEKEHALSERNVRFHAPTYHHWLSHNFQFDRLPYDGKKLPIDKDLPERRPLPPLSTTTKKDKARLPIRAERPTEVKALVEEEEKEQIKQAQAPRRRPVEVARPEAEQEKPSAALPIRRRGRGRIMQVRALPPTEIKAMAARKM